jgi:sugar phosphate isomerase/epimerase
MRRYPGATGFHFMKFSIVVSLDSTRFAAATFKGDFSDHIVQAARMGYDGVELAVRDPSSVDIEALQRLLFQHRLSVAALGTGQAYVEEGLSFTSADADVRQAAVERIHRHIELAAHFKAMVIIGLIRGMTPTVNNQSQAMAWLVQALQACTAVAYHKGVRLIVEPINRYETDLINTIDEGLTLLDKVGAPSATLGLLPDTFHMNIEEPSMTESMGRAAGSIFHFHVADSNRRYPGAGHLDFGHILSTLRDEVGYEDWVSAEILPHPDPQTAAMRALTHLRRCLERRG